MHLFACFAHLTKASYPVDKSGAEQPWLSFRFYRPDVSSIKGEFIDLSSSASPYIINKRGVSYMRNLLTTQHRCSFLRDLFFSLLVLTGLAVPAAVSASPIVYTAFTVADGRLGNWSFRDARVVLTQESDTTQVQTISVPGLGGGSVLISINYGGTASVTITTAQRTVHARFNSGEVFVSLDHGTIFTPPTPLVGGRGVGFGSFNPSASGGLEPAYPLGIEDGTIDWGDATLPSPALQALSLDLQHNTSFSGRGWICPGFTNFSCPLATKPLKTDQGDLFLQAPYYGVFACSSGATCNDYPLNGGLFTAELGSAPSRPSAYVTSKRAEGKSPITYTAAVVTSVDLGGKHYDHAKVFISMDTDRRDVAPTASGYIVNEGNARVKIVAGSRVIKADIPSGQIYAYFDALNGNVGFGSAAGGRGYPLAITGTVDSIGLLDHTLAYAVRSIIADPSAALNFSRGVSTLVTDFTNPTVLAGGASSCTALDPISSVCTNFTPVPIATSAGPLYLHELYTDDETTTTGTQRFSVGWGLFWIEYPAAPSHPSESDD